MNNESELLKLVNLYKTASLSEKDLIEFEKYKKQIFDFMIKDKNADTRKFVADDINTPVEFLTILSNDDSKKVVRAVAKNKNTPTEVLEKLTKYFDELIADEAKKNLNNKKVVQNVKINIPEKPEKTNNINILLKTIKCHDLGISSLSSTPNGKNIITGSSDETIKIWDLNGICLKTFKGHSSKVSTISISPDGKTIVSGSYDKMIKIWDLNGNCLKTFKDHKDWLGAIAISPDNKYIISGSYDNTIKIWDFNGICINTLTEHQKPVEAIAVTYKGNYIVSGSDDKTIRVWDFYGNCLRIITGHKDSVKTVSINFEGKNIVSGSYDKTIKIWDFYGNCLNTLEGHKNSVETIVITSDGKNIISGSNDKTIKIWDFKGNCLKTIEGHNYGISSLLITNSGNTLVSADTNGMIKLWDIQNILKKSIDEKVKNDIIDEKVVQIVDSVENKKNKILKLSELYKTASLKNDDFNEFEKYKKEIFEILVKDKNADTRKFVADDLMTPVEFLKILSTDDSKKVVRAVAKNKNTPIDILEKLLNYFDDSIVEEVKKNISSKKAVYVDESVQNKESNIFKLTELYKTLSLNDDDLIEFEKYKKEIFENLTNDKDKNIRKFVADDLITPVEFLIKLSKDKEERVRRGVAKNKNTPIEILKILIDDKEKSISEEAYKNLQSKIQKEIKVVEEIIINEIVDNSPDLNTEIPDNIEEEPVEIKNEQEKTINEEIPDDLPEEKENPVIFTDYKQYLSKAIECYNYEDYNEAINILTEGIKYYNHPFLFAYIAECYRKSGDLKQCENYYLQIKDKLLAIEDKNIGEPFNNYALYLYQTNQFEKAEEIIKIAIEISPQDINFLINYAEILIKLNKIDEMLVVLVNIYNLNSDAEKKIYLFSKYKKEFYIKLSKDARFGYVNGMIIPLNSYCDLINTAIHLKIVYIDSNGFISIMKDINAKEEKDFIKSDLLLKLYLNNSKKYVEITKQIIKGISAKIHYILEQYDNSNLKIIENYLINYENYPIIPPSILKYVIETMEHFGIDSYKISFLRNKIEDNKQSYIKYKINNPKLILLSMQDFYNKFN